MSNLKIDKEHYNPLNDLLFSKYMSEKGCEEILLSFLNALFKEFDKEIDSVKIIENKSIKSQYIGGKDCIVDLRAETETGERIIMEMQQTDSNEFRKRSLTYIFREYSNSPRKSTKYNYKPHTLIAITDFKFCEESEWYAKFNLADIIKCKCIFTDIFNGYIVDLSKFKKLKNLDLKNELTQWAIFFSKNKFPKEFKEVLEMNSQIKSAHKIIEESLSDGEEAWLYERIERRNQDFKNTIRDTKIEAKKEGIKEGKKEGKKEGIKEIAIKLKNKGTSLEEIVEITNLPIDTIKKLN